MSMSVEDMKIIVVTLFDEGHPMSEIAERLELSERFVKRAIIEWWYRMAERQREDEERWEC